MSTVLLRADATRVDTALCSIFLPKKLFQWLEIPQSEGRDVDD